MLATDQQSFIWGDCVPSVIRRLESSTDRRLPSGDACALSGTGGVQFALSDCGALLAVASVERFQRTTGEAAYGVSLSVCHSHLERADELGLDRFLGGSVDVYICWRAV